MPAELDPPRSGIANFTHQYEAEAHRIIEQQNWTWSSSIASVGPQWASGLLAKYPGVKQSQTAPIHLENALKKYRQRGYVHGDVRESNILVDKANTPAVL